MGRGLYYRVGRMKEPHLGVTGLGRSVTACNKDAKMSHFTFHVNLEILASAFHLQRSKEK